MWTTAVHEFVTGRPLLEVAPSDGSWGRGDQSSRTHTFPLRGDGLDRDQRRYLFRKWRRLLVQKWNGNPVYAGIIIDTDYDRDGGLLNVHHSPFRAITSKRYLRPPQLYTRDGVITISGVSLRGLIRELIRIGLVDPSAPGRALPVILTALEAGSLTRSFYDYEARKLERLLTDALAEDGAPDLDFAPVFVDDVLWHETRIGAPFLDGPDFDIPLQALLSPVRGIGISESGAEETNVIIGFGAGGEHDRFYATAATPDIDIALEGSEVFDTVEDQTQLQTLTDGLHSAKQITRTQWALELYADVIPPDQLTVGSQLIATSHGDPWAPDDMTALRVLAFSGTYSHIYKVDVELVDEEGI